MLIFRWFFRNVFLHIFFACRFIAAGYFKIFEVIFTLSLDSLIFIFIGFLNYSIKIKKTVSEIQNGMRLKTQLRYAFTMHVPSPFKNHRGLLQHGYLFFLLILLYIYE